MNRLLATAAMVLLFGGVVPAAGAPKRTAKAPDDLCKYLVDPYEWVNQKARFFKAAGPDNELTAKEFAANKSKADGFVRRFDSWKSLSGFDKDQNKSIDWIEAGAYRRDLRRRLLAAYDANKDGKLVGAERTAANSALARGRIAAPAKPSRRVHTSRSGRHHTTGRSDKDRRRSASIERQLHERRDDLRKQLYGLGAKLAACPAAADERKAYEDASKAYENAKKDPAMVEARKPYDDAKRAYEKAREALPEAQMYRKAEKAYSDARHSLPEYKARIAAREALGKIARNSQAYAGARNLYEDAEKAYEARKVTLPEYEYLKAASKAYEKATGSLAERKDRENAEKTYRAVYDRYLAKARKVRDDARKARDEKVAKLLKTDPEAVRINGQIKEVEDRVKKLHSSKSRGR